MKKITILFTCLIVSSISFGQEKADSIKTDITINAAAHKSGNTNDILTSFYQLALKNLFSKNNELNISTTVFALIDSHIQHITVDSLYRKYRWARRFQITASGKIDSNNNISSIGLGVTYAIIDRRDITKKNVAFDQLSKYEKEIGKYKKEAFNNIQQRIEAQYANDEQRVYKIDSAMKARKKAIYSSIRKFEESGNKEDLDNDFVAALDDDCDKYALAKHSEDSCYTYIINDIKRKPLWTITGSYRNHPMFNNKDTVTVQSDFVYGFGGNLKRLWELTASGNVKTYNLDSAVTDNMFAHAELGLNKILLVDKDGNSKMEFKFFGSYDQSLSKTGVANFAANATFRTAIYKDLWFPVSIKYDPQNGRLFGFLNITYNIDKGNKKTSN